MLRKFSVVILAGIIYLIINSLVLANLFFRNHYWVIYIIMGGLSLVIGVMIGTQKNIKTIPISIITGIILSLLVFVVSFAADIAELKKFILVLLSSIIPMVFAAWATSTNQPQP